MIPIFLASTVILYGIIQFTTALIAIFLAFKWNKFEFLPGLSFLFLYAVVDLIDLLSVTFENGMFIDFAQFGFILLAIIFFITGMHPVYAPKLVSALKGEKTETEHVRDESAISILKKL
jgi:hypothetical protein